MLRQTLEAKNIFKQENVMLQLTFNPGLTLTDFRTTRPRALSLFPSLSLKRFPLPFVCVEPFLIDFIPEAFKMIASQHKS